MDLAGRTAVITGAASGIGRALALEAAARGMDLALLDVDEAALNGLRPELTQSGRDPLIACVDITDLAALERFATATAARFNDIAAVFVNAGVLRAGTLAEQPAATWKLMIDVNLTGSLGTITSFLPILLERRQPARIVITGSQSSLVARPDVCVYSATKHALWAIAEGLKFELDRTGAPIGVSFVAPGAVATGLAGPAQAGGHPAQDYLRHALAEHGMAAAALARSMFDAVAAERFWILPAPETKGQLSARVQRILDEQDPLP
jgi:NAD(P)-dependent dehydrogenase (short-subunit alcohol dehydrogenase family)